ncbi:MAG: hypothetical protein K0S65_5183 [Labilithrix sp.]|nr:hypothetical protein [Labilithrix sp.]
MPWAWADSRWRALIRAALVLTAWSLFTRPALCADATFALTWRSEAKTPCVTETALRAGVARKLGHAPFAEHERAETVIEGEERALDGGRWRARIAERDRGGALLGEREISAKSCESLLRAATFVVALFIDPNRDQDQELASDDEAPTSVRDEPPAAIPAPAPPSPTRAPDTQRPPSSKPSAFDLRLGIGASAGAGLLPSVNGSMLASARLEQQRSPWSFDWTAAYSWPQEIAHGTIRGEFAAVEQRVRACLALFDDSRTRIESCGGAMWAAIMPQTTGVLAASDAWKRLIGPTVALALEVRAGGRAARLEAGLEVPFGRYAFSYLSNNGDTKLFYASSGVLVFVALTGLMTISP